MVSQINNTPPANGGTQVKKETIEQTNQRQQVTQQKQAAPAPQQTAAQAKQDSVSITPQAKQMARLQEKANNSSGIDQEKVSKIKQAIADGKYQINVEQLARRIMQFEGEIFRKS